MPERVIRLPGNRRIFYDRLSPSERVRCDAMLAEFNARVQKNPIEGFDWHSPAQRDFLAADTKIVAAIAGNRFGKTTSLVVKALIECLPARALPEHLRQFRRFDAERVDGWIVCPTEEKVFDSLKPAFERWVGAEHFRGGAWGKAFNGERMQLTFSNGSTINFKTYKQDASTLGGASLWFVGYDEPPPKDHREECRTRLVDHNGFEMFAMTPIKTNTGYIKRAIYKRRENANVTLVRGSIHDNSTLSKEGVAAFLAEFDNDLWRRAREFGDFVDVGGLIYEDFERRVIDPPAPSELDRSDVVVGIDPGIRNTGIVFVAFDRHGVGTVFKDVLLQDAQTEGVASAIWGVLDAYQIPRQSPLFVIDPSVPRTQTSEYTLQTALAVLGVGCAKAQNDLEAGIQQVRSRLTCGRLFISKACTGLRDEADEYAAEDRPDGEFKPIKGHDHRLDALRYACMTRPFFPALEQQAPERNLGFRPGVAIPARWLEPQIEVPPLGAMS